MKVDRSINFISDLAAEDWRTIYTRHKLLYNSQNGIVFCPYITNVFDISSMYPHKIEVKVEVEVNETKIRYRTYKRYTPGP